MHDEPRPRRTSLVAFLLLLAFLLVGFDAINGLAGMRTASALAHGNAVLSFEQHLHISVEGGTTRWLVRHTTLARTANWTYNTVQIVVTTAVLALLWWRRPRLFARLRWVILGANLVALAVFWLYPVAPPRLLPGRGVVDVIAVDAVPFGWKPGILPDTPNQFQALPSLHAAWSTWVCVVVFCVTARWWLRALAVAYPLFVGFLIVVTGTHSIVDFVAGSALTLLLTAVVAAARQRRDGSAPAVGAAGAGDDGYAVSPAVRRRATPVMG